MKRLERQIPDFDKIRFAVGTDDGPRSSWWFVRASDAGDVYVSAIPLGGHMKLSLHRIHENPKLDRFCQLGFTDRQISALAKSELPSPSKKFMSRWQRPPSPSHGVRLILSIMIPTDFLNRNPSPKPSSRPKLLFPPAPTGQAVEFLLFYSLEAAGELERTLQRIGYPMFYVPFANGESVHFIARRAPFSMEALLALQRTRIAPQPLSRVTLDMEPDESLSGLSSIIANDPFVDGYICLVEASNLVVTRRT